MSTGQMQQRNAQNVRLLASDFQLRYEPNFAWKSAVSAFLALPALRAFWPMSSVDYTAASRARDLSGQGYHLSECTETNPQFGYDSLAPYVDLDGNDCLYRTDGGGGQWADILGTESYIVTGLRGLTFGGWFQPDQINVNAGLITKASGVAAGDAYQLEQRAVSEVRFRISDGVATDEVITTTDPFTTTDWHFVAGRFEPSTQIDVIVDGIFTPNAVGIPAALNDSPADFTIGSFNAGSFNFFDGRASMCFLCAACLSDAIILSLFHQTRALFGV